MIKSTPRQDITEDKQFSSHNNIIKIKAKIKTNLKSSSLLPKENKPVPKTPNRKEVIINKAKNIEINDNKTSNNNTNNSLKRKKELLPRNTLTFRSKNINAKINRNIEEKLSSLLLSNSFSERKRKNKSIIKPKYRTPISNKRRKNKITYSFRIKNHKTNNQNNNKAAYYSFINADRNQIFIKKKTLKRNNLSEQKRNKNRIYYPIATSPNFNFRNEDKDELIKKRITFHYDIHKTKINNTFVKTPDKGMKNLINNKTKENSAIKKKPINILNDIKTIPSIKKEKLKVIKTQKRKTPSKNKDNEKDIIKIQSLFRGYIFRKKLYSDNKFIRYLKAIYILNNLNISLRKTFMERLKPKTKKNKINQNINYNKSYNKNYNNEIKLKMKKIIAENNELRLEFIEYKNYKDKYNNIIEENKKIQAKNNFITKQIIELIKQLKEIKDKKEEVVNNEKIKQRIKKENYGNTSANNKFRNSQKIITNNYNIQSQVNIIMTDSNICKKGNTKEIKNKNFALTKNEEKKGNKEKQDNKTKIKAQFEKNKREGSAKKVIKEIDLDNKIKNIKILENKKNKKEKPKETKIKDKINDGNYNKNENKNKYMDLKDFENKTNNIKIRLLKEIIKIKKFKYRENLHKYFLRYYYNVLYLKKLENNNQIENDNQIENINQIEKEENDKEEIVNNNIFINKNINEIKVEYKDKNLCIEEESIRIKRNKELRDLIFNKIRERQNCLHKCFTKFYYKGLIVYMKNLDSKNGTDYKEDNNNNTNFIIGISTTKNNVEQNNNNYNNKINDNSSINYNTNINDNNSNINDDNNNNSNINDNNNANINDNNNANINDNNNANINDNNNANINDNNTISNDANNKNINEVLTKSDNPFSKARKLRKILIKKAREKKEILSKNFKEPEYIWL